MNKYYRIKLLGQGIYNYLKDKPLVYLSDGYPYLNVNEALKDVHLYKKETLEFSRYYKKVSKRPDLQNQDMFGVGGNDLRIFVYWLNNVKKIDCNPRASWFSEYTYNEDYNFSNDFIYCKGDHASNELAFLQLHQGSDARCGFSDSVVVDSEDLNTMIRVFHDDLNEFNNSEFREHYGIERLSENEDSEDYHVFKYTEWRVK